MDPIHPIVPRSTDIPAVPRVQPNGRVDPEGRRREEEAERRRRRRRAEQERSGRPPSEDGDTPIIDVTA